MPCPLKLLKRVGRNISASPKGFGGAGEYCTHAHVAVGSMRQKKKPGRGADVAGGGKTPIGSSENVNELNWAFACRRRVAQNTENIVTRVVNRT